VSGGYRVGPDGGIWPVDPADLAAGVAAAAGGWPPAVDLAPARQAWREQVEQVQAAHLLAVAAHAALVRAMGVLADTVRAERVAWVAYRDAAGY
jgi:hypothetical protein